LAHYYKTKQLNEHFSTYKLWKILSKKKLLSTLGGVSKTTKF